MATGPEEPVVRERSDRCIGGPCLRLDREDAEAHLLEQSFVRERSDAAEFGEAGLDRPPLPGVLGGGGLHAPVPPHRAKRAVRSTDLLDTGPRAPPAAVKITD